MSQKRKHVDGAEEASAPKPPKKQRSFKPGDGPHKPKSKRPNLSHADDNARGINALKSRVRDLKRLLAHVDNVPKHKMSASARQERERELEACEHELAEKQRSSREAEYKQKMIGKYHQVRFFDRQKGTRILKRLKKEHAGTEDVSERSQLRQRIHNAEVDVNYAIYYPLMKPYSSLYPKSHKGAETDGPKGDVDMWKAVEQAMEDGTLDTLRHSRDALPAEPPKKAKKPKMNVDEAKSTAKVDSKPYRAQEVPPRRSYAPQQDSDDSDGGFFEES